MSDKPPFLQRVFTLLWNTINTIRKLIINVIFFSILAIIFVAIASSDNEILLENDTSLVLDLSGHIVDQKRYVDPIEAALMQSQGASTDAEVLLSDILFVIQNATQDARISSIVLNLSNMQSAGVSKLSAIGKALEEFKAAGKTVIAMENGYNQQQYFIASYADTIFLNPKGWIGLEGLSSYNMYFKSLLEKMKINTHVFRVGTYKSAVEPFIRDDMSDEDKASKTQLLDDIWQTYSAIVAKNRNIPKEDLVLNSDRYLTELDKAKGDGAQVAMNLHWVDELVSAEQFRLAMIDQFSANQDGTDFKQISMSDYQTLIAPLPVFVETDAIGIVVAKGNILNGQQPAGNIGGDTVSQFLRKARLNDHIKAVVLRVDSPGGSAFASEQIRQEVLALKAAGKPVVVSMGSLAASGGYWISASADYIYATPSTLTGSIGIFGLFATIEDALAHFGIYTDGVATSDWAGLSPARALSPNVKQVIQRHIERGYLDFISLVAEERNMTLEQVDSIAQGRVWTGSRALDLGLVDELGDMDQAIAKAAELAGMESFDTKVIEKELTPEEIFIQELIGASAQYLPQSVKHTSTFELMLKQFSQVLDDVAKFDDPKGMYLYCEECIH